MRLTILLVFLSLLNIEANTYSQNTKFTLDLKDVTVERIFDEIKNSSEFKILHATNEIDLQRVVSISVNQQVVEVILSQLFSNTPVIYKIVDKQIVLSLQEEKPISNKSKKNKTVNHVIKVQNTITGTVSDANGYLPGVNVITQGASIGAVTDFDGKYSIVANKGAVLVFSFIGMQTQSITVGDSNTINVILAESEDSLDEVIVIGYGTQKKKDMTGAVSSVTSNDFKSQPMVNATDALQGRAAGVFVGSTNGAPGGRSKILIRGANSILGSSDPLVVIDGIVGGAFRDVDPAEIASIEVLKDASSTAIFGSRGANGVILITTKTGKSSKPTVSFNTFYGMQSVSKRIDLLPAYEFATEANAQDLAIGGDGDIYSPAEIAALQQSGGTDWQDELFRSAPTQNYQLSVGGKLNKTDYYFSMNHANQEGIIINTGFKRYNARANVNSQVSDKVKMGLNLNVIRTQGRNNQSRSSLSSPVYGALAFDPTMPIYNDEGFYNLGSIKNVGTLGINPVAQQLEFNTDSENSKVVFNAYIDYEIIEGLKLNVSVGNISALQVGKTFNAELNRVNSAYLFNGDFRLNQVISRLTYEKEINDHRFKIDAIHELQKSKWSQSNINGDDIAYPLTTYNNIGTANSIIAGSYAWERTLESLMGRVNYTFKDKYIVTGTVRSDGSSILAKGNEYSIFPSGAIAWRISQEDFMQNSNVFDELKLRTSYGLTGNQGIEPYQSFAAFEIGPTQNYPFDDATAVIGASPVRLQNDDLRWETTAQFNIGIDATFLNGRFSVVLDYYKKLTDGILMRVPIAPYRGGLKLTANIGSIENTGFEFAVSASVVDGDKFKWDANFNMAINETIVTDLGGETEYFIGTEFGLGQAVAPAVILEVGERTGNFYGYLYDGVWKSNEAAEAAVYGNIPGDAKYKDLDGDGAINSNDLGVMGNGQADLIWGLNNTFIFMNFDLNIFFQGVHGNEIWNLGRGYTFGGSGDARNATTVDIRNRWTPQNENTNVPGYSSTSVNQIQSSRYVEDGSFVRLKNISLGYNLPESLIKRSKLFESFRVYISGLNLLTLTNYSGFDPEVSNTGNSSINQSIDFGAYPTAKSVLIGLNVTF
ncbi:MAG: TonB-dependent receptor [Flavobacteriaceae bacterium]|nr:TonB-dependent receptor [Flavobacteriaceae bacterium]